MTGRGWRSPRYPSGVVEKKSGSWWRAFQWGVGLLFFKDETGPNYTCYLAQLYLLMERHHTLPDPKMWYYRDGDLSKPIYAFSVMPEPPPEGSEGCRPHPHPCASHQLVLCLWVCFPFVSSLFSRFHM